MLFNTEKNSVCCIFYRIIVRFWNKRIFII